MMLNRPRQQTALRVFLLYIVMAACWFIGSNRVLLTLLRSSPRIFDLQLVADFLFVVITGSICYLTLRRMLNYLQQSAEALAAERNLLRTLIDNVPEYILVKDRASRYVLNNAAHLRSLHVTNPEEVIGKSDADFYPPELAARYLADDQIVLSTGRPFIHREEPSLDDAGRPIWVSATKVPLRASQGNVTGLVEIVRDITEIKAAQEALQREHDELERRVQERTADLLKANADLKAQIAERERIEAELQARRAELNALLAAMTDFIFVIDRQGRYVKVAQTNSGQAGKSHGELIGKTLYHVFPAAQADQFIGQDIARALDIHQTVSAEYSMHIDGKEYWYSAAISPLPPDSVVWVARDITERKRMEEALRQAHDELERRVQERTAELERANRLLQQEIAERTRVEAAEREQRTLAEALRDTAAALNSTLNFDEVLDRILSNLDCVVKHDVGNIMMIEDGVGRVVRQRGYSDPNDIAWIQSLRLPIQETPNLRRMVETGKPVVVPEIDKDESWIRLSGSNWLRSYAGAPIRLNGEVIGFIDMDSATPGFFNATHAERLAAFADQAAIAIQNARLYEQAQVLAAFQERQRLARDLHDAVSQTLFSASVIAESLPRLLKRDPIKAQHGLVQLHQLTRGAMAEMRTLLLELRPAQFAGADLGQLLRQLTEAVTARLDAAVSINVECSQPLPVEVKIALYRMAQEALNNAAKHARASQIAVTLAACSKQVELRIRDNGRGFDQTVIRPGHLGLEIMQERAAAIGATLTIQSQPGQGTTVVVIWTGSKEVEP